MTKLLKHMKNGHTRKGSIADLLLQAQSAYADKSLTDRQMFPEIAALFFAGSDTTAHAAAFIL